ncbi:tungstate transport system substrate-binding protein [Loktanella ponticola]|uniref:Tungstate transport system substrate-binding protein n=1 Tax=Yoonia ponticola TaxID=1524255 RepID=A0A7W9BJD6_9RHOB|nr:substrate-binding domain-containing protein [Yoonia ponticola]MBB5721411.1 tungstate transport system substrate-binding protein [Yoonia ponticola]
MLFKVLTALSILWAAPGKAEQDITFGMTTTQEASGFANALLGEMKTAFPTFDLSYSIAGTSQQLRVLQDGFVPFAITHNAAKEQELIAQGDHTRQILFANDFLFVGPETSTITCQSIHECLAALLQSDETFMSRGDQSGTHAYEMAQWAIAGIDPNALENYQVSSGGAANSLRICGIRNCHIIVDESSFSTSQRNGLVEIARDPGTNLYSLISAIDFAQGAGQDILLWVENEAPRISEKFGYRRP